MVTGAYPAWRNGEVVIPNQGVGGTPIALSPDCMFLLSMLLKHNPAERPTVDQIWANVWFQRDLHIFDSPPPSSVSQQSEDELLAIADQAFPVPLRDYTTPEDNCSRILL